MENKLTEKELKSSMLDVRQAYRLLFEHQTRIISLIDYIKDYYGMKIDGGNKFFSDPIRPKRNDYSKVWTQRGMWAWDFFYSYLFEFYLGDLETKSNGKNKDYFMSIIEICDTGYWDSINENRSEIDINTFASVDESSSCLVFVFESIDKKKKNYYWTDKNKLGEELYKFLFSKKSDYFMETTEDNWFSLVKYDMSSFINQACTDKILNEYHNLIANKTGIQLFMKNI